MIPKVNRPRLVPFGHALAQNYGRLFAPDPRAARAARRDRLECLAGSMKDKEVTVPSDSANHHVPAGYTYFGQFIDHDLTYDTSPLPNERTPTNPSETTNFRRNWLNLDNLYGEGPGSRDSRLYDKNNASFRLGHPVVRTSVPDVPLDAANKPLAADPRNLENFLVRQVHSLFLALHNIAVDQLSRSLSERDRFIKARQRVRHQYQWLVRHDFLGRLCDESIYSDLVTRANPLVDWSGGFSIPVEFAQAAFRFGHSMVREEYHLGSEGAEVKLHALFGGKESTGPLADAHVINWTDFLVPHSPNPEFAGRINTSIIPQLFELPTDALKAFVQVKPNDTLALPVRTMMRGAASQLPSGQRARRLLKEKRIPSTTDGSNNPWTILEECHLGDETPLWYYVLLEAEVMGGGLRLGPVGSRIVAEVIEGALWSNPDSFLRQYGRYWRPDPWLTSSGARRIDSLYDLAVVLRLVDP
jgi:hypothetical protein